MAGPVSFSARDFGPVSQAGKQQWSRPKRFTFFDELATAEIADSELLHLSHYAPIAIQLGQNGPEVVLVLHSILSSARLVNDDGKWTPPYAPMAIRCLPFRNAYDNQEPEFAPSLCDATSSPLGFVETDGKPTKEFDYVLLMLQRLADGGARLANAAKVLLAADVVVPLVRLSDQPDLSLLVVSAERVLALSGTRSAALTADANLPFELAAASIFSQRWLAHGSIQETPAAVSTERRTQERHNFEQGFNDSLEQPFLMDDSGMFSIDDFLGNAGANDDHS